MIADSQLCISDSERVIFPKPRLTPTETNVYNYFLRRPGMVITYDELKQYLYVSSKSSIWEHVGKVIKKSGANIRSVRGVGYILETLETS